MWWWWMVPSALALAGGAHELGGPSTPPHSEAPAPGAGWAARGELGGPSTPPYSEAPAPGAGWAARGELGGPSTPPYSEAPAPGAGWAARGELGGPSTPPYSEAPAPGAGWAARGELGGPSTPPHSEAPAPGAGWAARGELGGPSTPPHSEAPAPGAGWAARGELGGPSTPPHSEAPAPGAGWAARGELGGPSTPPHSEAPAPGAGWAARGELGGPSTPPHSEAPAPGAGWAARGELGARDLLLGALAGRHGGNRAVVCAPAGVRVPGVAWRARWALVRASQLQGLPLHALRVLRTSNHLRSCYLLDKAPPASQQRARRVVAASVHPLWGAGGARYDAALLELDEALAGSGPDPPRNRTLAHLHLESIEYWMEKVYEAFWKNEEEMKMKLNDRLLTFVLVVMLPAFTSIVVFMLIMVYTGTPDKVPYSNTKEGVITPWMIELYSSDVK